jgi:tRNA-intron endonuclease
MAEDEVAEAQLPRDETGPEQFTQKFGGTLRGFRVIVAEDAVVEELARKGFGEKQDEGLHLKFYEALYLMRLGWLTVKSSDGHPVSFDFLVRRSLKEDHRGWTKFLVYRDLRGRGYVVREGYGMAADLRVYPRGEYGKSPAKYVVVPVNEGGAVKLSKLQEVIDAVYRMGKEPIIAVVERRGEAIYYRASKMVFEGP